MLRCAALLCVSVQFVRSGEVGRVISLHDEQQRQAATAAAAAEGQQQQHEEQTNDEVDEPDDGEDDEDDEQKYEGSAAASSLARRLAKDDSVQGCFAHEDSAYCVEVYQQMACSGDGNDTAVLWNTHTGDVLHVLKGQRGSTEGEQQSHTDSVLARQPLTYSLTAQARLPVECQATRTV